MLSEEEREVESEEMEPAAEWGYFMVSRTLAAGFLFSLPLLLAYEAGVLALGADINAAAAIVKTPISWLKRHPSTLGVNPVIALNAALIVGTVAAALILSRREALTAGLFAAMFGESAAYALLLGPLAMLPLTGRIEFAGFRPKIQDAAAAVVLSSGAGYYEEFLFRFLLLGGLYLAARRVGGLGRFGGGTAALFVSATLFSAAHFLSPAEPAEFGVFLYRLMAGMILGVIFLVRGFGIAAWTHTLYDIYVILFVS